MKIQKSRHKYVLNKTVAVMDPLSLAANEPALQRNCRL